MAKEPIARYPDAAAFLAALEESADRDLGAVWLAAASIAGLASVPRPPRRQRAGGAPSSVAATSATGHSSNVAKFVSRRRVPLTVGAAVVAVVVVAAIALAGGGDKKQATPPSTQFDPAKAAAIAKQQRAERWVALIGRDCAG